MILAKTLAMYLHAKQATPAIHVLPTLHELLFQYSTPAGLCVCLPACVVVPPRLCLPGCCARCGHIKAPPTETWPFSLRRVSHFITHAVLLFGTQQILQTIDTANGLVPFYDFISQFVATLLADDNTSHLAPVEGGLEGGGFRRIHKSEW